MPIHFACEHCTQLLSIDARKLGQQVDCPRCHRRLTVPDEQGAARTLQLRQERKRRVTATSAGAAAPAVEAAAAPAPNAAVADDESYAQFLNDFDTELVYEDTAGEPALPFDRHKVAVPRSVIYVQGVLLGAVALVAFTLGALVGGGTRPREVAKVPEKPCSITGTLMVQNRNQQEQPDPGAVIIVVPEGELPANGPLAAEGLRPDSPALTDDHPGRRSVRELGGDLARADTQGAFQVVVARPGKYRVLVLSGTQQRAAHEAIRNADLAQIGSYFQNANELIGDNRYLWTLHHVRGDVKLQLTVP